MAQNNSAANHSSVPAIVAGIVAVVLILTLGYLLMNGTFSMGAGMFPTYTPNMNSAGNSTDSKSSKSSSSGSSGSNGSNGSNGLPGTDLDITGKEVSGDADDGVKLNILTPKDDQKQPIDIGL